MNADSSPPSGCPARAPATTENPGYRATQATQATQATRRIGTPGRAVDQTQSEDATTLGLLCATTFLAAHAAARDGRHLRLQHTSRNLKLVLGRIEALPAEEHYNVLDVVHEQLRSAVDPAPGVPAVTPRAAPPNSVTGLHFAAHLTRAVRLTSDDHHDHHDEAVDALRRAASAAHALAKSNDPNTYRDLMDTLIAQAEHDLGLKRAHVRKA